jgi:hypothetical protein
MLTIEFSSAKAKNVATGNQIAAIFPVVEVELIPSMVPSATIQLHKMPLTKALSQPYHRKHGA